MAKTIEQVIEQQIGELLETWPELPYSALRAALLAVARDQRERSALLCEQIANDYDNSIPSVINGELAAAQRDAVQYAAAAIRNQKES